MQFGRESELGMGRLERLAEVAFKFSGRRFGIVRSEEHTSELQSQR